MTEADKRMTESEEVVAQEGRRSICLEIAQFTNLINQHTCCPNGLT